jgi:hypothetical protein
MTSEIFVSLMLGFIFGMMIVAGLPDNQIKKVIEECERDLPRNQHCVITGVVEKRNE